MPWREKPMAETRPVDVHPPYLYPDYKSTRLRAPAQPLVRVAPSPLETAGPVFPKRFVGESEADLTTWGTSAPLGENPHPVDDHDAPLDPNFLGKGQVLTDDEGRYRVVTVKPGAYPWQNHPFGWRPAHIHFSLFGNAYAQRLITQMFFPGDPLLAIDPIFQSVPEAGRKLLIADLDLEQGIEGVALGYRWDLVVRGPRATPMGV
ncbi:MAG: protocatechuate 3,4-dioxygenase subunit beta [Candidatus Rokuibacteriota bacterium]|nr:MAG: protocatechuate 3,4-dioxygenase subunit beta [Candidatus Rokubacteria bacterium]